LWLLGRRELHLYKKYKQKSLEDPLYVTGMREKIFGSLWIELKR
jgi:hypothetical protein